MAEEPPTDPPPAEGAPAADAPPADGAAPAEAAPAEGAPAGDAPAEGGEEQAPADTPASEAPKPAATPEEDFGLRPLSSISGQGAIEIEGFDDDFEDDQFNADDSRDNYEEEEESVAEQSEEADLPDVETLIVEAQEERSRLQAANAVLLRKLFTIFNNRKSTEVRDAQGKLQAEGQDTRYQQALAQWAEQLEEKQRIQRHFETQTFDMKARLEERMTRANDIRSAFRNFKLEVARSSENSRTGKPIPERIIQEKMSQELKKEGEVERVRLKNIQLRNQMKKLEAHLKAKEELAEGLHLIDFEQLKIENQSLNEKIEERNEELLKLRKKTTTTVQVLTHLKEKLQFVQKENEVLQYELESLDVDLAERRDALQRQKHDRDVLRSDNMRIKAQSGIVTHPQLLDDFEIQKEKREVLTEQVATLKTRHTQITTQMKKLKRQLSMSEMQMQDTQASFGTMGGIGA
mmetsp:Transcript_23290/g.28144  ORF Transcript_23290/g.28144 Transcript_23290/m.28144 type:complete len:462 (+) Transcript_23290:103-1488(+)|eukprot:CAMPEP_0197861512 /NCGR_PEP_ID=MMETSP1438-20131217/37615_1 /TAXON_ID=1461541 /ORGANISM="Pterosperma sp., Strain CCMP1384" /LENGTH=461 /DNA_ID=CAMNT_0043478711 /DNA_START=95 /DNA_END=1480 /DNA_ORIENTATION=+